MSAEQISTMIGTTPAFRTELDNLRRSERNQAGCGETSTGSAAALNSGNVITGMGEICTIRHRTVSVLNMEETLADIF